MSAQPKYEIGSTASRLYATALLGRKKQSNFDGLGNEIVGGLIVLAILFALVGGISGKVAGISGTVTIGLLLAFIIEVAHTPETVEI